MARILIVNTLVEQDGKLLMHRRNFPPGAGKFDPPGGYVDEGETVEQAAIRETKEETGFDVVLEKKFGNFDYFDREEKTTHVFIAKIVSGELNGSVEGGAEWVEPEKLKKQDMAFPHHFLIIKKYLESKK